ncbi:MAG: hypothetical protein GF330_14010 [Candidatus Eisenbacteria bacterium]|nr:hypothetical protein [Candidatus Eisenbacteria bacterium]
MASSFLQSMAPGVWASGALLLGLILGNLGAAGLAPSCLLGSLAVLGGILLFSLRCHERGRGGTCPIQVLLLLGLFVLLGLARGGEEHQAWQAGQAQLSDQSGTAWICGSLDPGSMHRSARIRVTAVRCWPDERVCPLAAPLCLLIGASREDRAAMARYPSGCAVEGFVRIEAPRGRRLPGGWDDRIWLRLQGTAGWLKPLLLRARAIPVRATRQETHGSGPGAIRQACEQSGSPLDRCRIRSPLDRSEIRARLERCGVRGADWVARQIGGAEGWLAAALLLGRRALRAGGWKQPAQAAALRRAGAGHLLALSGLHVGLVAGTLSLLFLPLPLPRSARWLLLAMAMITYACVVGGGTAVARAAGGGALWCLLRAAGRAARPLHLLCVLAASLIWIEPALWRSAGFQLSFLVTAALLVGVSSRRGWRGWLAALISAQLCAWPLTLAHFTVASPLYLLTNAVLLPLTVLLMPILLLGVALEASGLGPAGVAVALPRVLCTLLLEGGSLLGQLSERLAVAVRLPMGWGLASSLGLVWILGARGVARRLRATAALVLVGAVTQIALLQGPDIRIYMLDVGQGESWLLLWGTESWAIDLGPGSSGPLAHAGGMHAVLHPCARRRIDRLFFTHGDADHVSGWHALAASGMRPDRIYHPEGWRPPPALADWIAELRERGSQVRALAAGDRLCLGDGPADCDRATVLHPPQRDGVRRDAPTGAQRVRNENSLALLLEADGLRLLISGDAPAHAAQDWAAAGTCGRLDLLSAAHHGSADGTPAPLLEAARPQAVLASVGSHNRYGHPSPQLCATLHEMGIPLLRTDREGSLCLARDRFGWWIEGSASGRVWPLAPSLSCRHVRPVL